MPQPTAYLDALKMLARRELSEAQVRSKLARHGHQQADIQTAVARLKSERAIDDGRVAEAIARTQISMKGRGRLRVLREIERAGIAPHAARRAVDEAFSSIDDSVLIAAAARKRLHDRSPVTADRDLGRLYRYLVGQGFEPDKVMAHLRTLRSEAGSDD
jgi:regulatory protein